MIKMSIKGNPIAEIEAQFKKLTLENTRRVAAELEKALEKATPVDTGEAQQGWKLRFTANGAEVFNSVPHVLYLNQGSSKQAPAYFIETTALRFGKPVGSIVEREVNVSSSPNSI
jgi:hypothetical protein